MLEAGEEGVYEDAIECGEIEIRGLREAELVNHILAAALRYELRLGDSDRLVGEVDREVLPRVWVGKAPAVDARQPVSSLNNRLALAMHNILSPSSGLDCWFSNCDARWVVRGVASQPPPSPTGLMQLMVEAAKAGLDKQRWLDEQMGRGFVHYPMQVGEPERSGRRGYDDSSADDAVKYDNAHADDDDHGGDDDDDMSDSSGNNFDGQYGA